MKSDYEEKKEARIEGYKNRSGKAKKESTDAYNRAGEIGYHIPFGQPILIGHHSEKRHRKDIEKIDNAMRKSCELRDKAKYYEDRAGAAESNEAISSDDPEAIVKLKEKIGFAEKSQEMMRAANKIIKKKKLSDKEKIFALIEIGIPEPEAHGLLTPDFCNRFGFASYSLTNNNANIKRMKKRLEILEAQKDDITTETQFKGGWIIDNVEENRLQIDFDEKPGEEIRKALKSRAFKWAPSAGVWQRFRSNDARYYAKEIIKKYYS